MKSFFCLVLSFCCFLSISTLLYGQSTVSPVGQKLLDADMRYVDIDIDSVQDSPDAFSPNSDGKYDEVTIGYVILGRGKVTVTVYDSNGALVKVVRRLGYKRLLAVFRGVLGS